jgi:hypothetical protein
MNPKFWCGNTENDFNITDENRNAISRLNRGRVASEDVKQIRLDFHGVQWGALVSTEMSCYNILDNIHLSFIDIYVHPSFHINWHFSVF